MKTIGVIGAGMIAQMHIANLHKMGRSQVKWVVGTNKTTLAEKATKLNVPHFTTDYHEVLADPEVEAVIIATPPSLHKSMFEDAAKAGKHILLEKPMAMNREEVDEIMKVRAAYPNLIISSGSARHTRLQPKYHKVKEIIDSGKLGEVYYIHHVSVGRQARPGVEYHPEAKWFLNKKLSGGGPMFDWGGL